MQNYQKLNRSISILLVILSLGCSTSVLAEQPKQFHMLGKVNGDLYIVPKGGKSSKGFIGNRIDPLSKLILGDGVFAIVSCSDGREQNATPGKYYIEKICKNIKSPIFRYEINSIAPLGEDPIPNPERLEIETNVKILQQQPIDNDAKGIAIAYLYKSHGLDQKAIDELKRLADGGSQTTAVYQLLGDIYHHRKINEKRAIDSYQIGLDLATKEGNVKAQKYIQAQLKELRKIAN